MQTLVWWQVMADKPYLGLEYVRKMPDKTERCNDRQATKKVSHFGLFFPMSTFIIKLCSFQQRFASITLNLELLPSQIWLFVVV
jgi:hypothetical protein